MKNFILLGLSLMLFTQIAAQNIILSELPTQNQLPTGEIHCIYQDSEGYMWYGTEGGGLCRDDGYMVKTFRADFNNPFPIESNNITCITEDKDQRIWFGTKRGAYILDKSNYKITPLLDEDFKGWIIKTITVTADGTIWVSAGEFIHKYNSKGQRLGRYSTTWDGYIKTIYNVYVDNNNILWLLQWRGGLLQYDPEKDDFVPYYWPFEESPTCMLKDCSSPYYWIGTWGNGIIRFDPNQTDSSKIFLPQPSSNDYTDVLQKRVTSIAQDSSKHSLWVTTMNNLSAYAIAENDTLQSIDTSSFLSSENKMVSSVVCDRSGNIWVASYYPRSFIMSYQLNKTVRYPMLEARKNLGFPASPLELCYENGHYWIWQKRMRLCLYQPEKDNLLIYKNRKLSSFFEKSHDDPGIYTAMSDSIILLIQYNDNKIQESRICTLPTDTHERIRTLHDDSRGNLWIGTTYNLFRYDLKAKKLHKEQTNTGIINDIQTTNDGSIFLATETEGFWYISPNKNVYKHNTDENYITLTISPDQKVWIGTQLGNVYYYDQTKDVLISKTKECGLTGDVISKIKSDNKGNIWILTDQKITIFNPEKQILDLIHCTDPAINMNNFLSLYEDEQKKIHIGGTGGILTFPSFRQENKSTQKLQISLTATKINNELKLLTRNSKEIILQPNQRDLELFFSTFDPLNTNKIRYAFRYKEKGNYWNYLPEGKNSIYLTELPKGSYNLEIRATDKNGIWSDNTIVVLIKRLPAWYETWWAYTLYTLIGMAFIVFMIQKYIQNQKEKQRIEMEKQVSQMKYNFFTNVSHELRTPLTLIITPLETVIKKTSDKGAKQQLESINKNAESLLNLVNQLLDFRKIEMGGEILSLTKGDINRFVFSVYENFQLIASEKQLTFNYHSDISSFYIFFDHDKLQKIINNLLSNAIKFTQVKGHVQLSLLHQTKKDNKNYIIIRVNDTGKGIPTDKLSLIFERFQQVNNQSGDIGSGIGLHLVKEYTSMHGGQIEVKSELNKGSEFSIYIPTDLSPKEKDVNLEIEINKETLYKDQKEDKDKKILIVEDNTEFRTYLKDELSMFYTVYETSNGLDAEKKAQEIEPDIIITDLIMPGIDGIELCHRVKNNINISHIPIILLTANDNIENEKRGYKEGADAYIAKPFHWDILLSRIQNLMEQKIQRQQTFEKEIEVNPSSITISSLDEQLIKKAFDLVEKNIGNSEYSIENLSKDMGMSRVSLYRKINSITGNTPTDFVKNIRLKRASELLQQGNLTIVEVAYSVGFNTPSYFTKSFKEKFGVLPTNYNERNK